MPQSSEVDEKYQDLLLRFGMILFGLVTVNIFSSLYKAIRISFKDVFVHKGISEVLGNIAFITGLSKGEWVPFIDPQATGVASIALAFVAMMTFISHYVFMNKNKNEFTRRYNSLQAMFDWCIAFFFYCITQSLEYFHNNLVVDTNTTWLLFIVAFALLIARLLLSNLHEADVPHERDFKVNMGHYLLVCLLFSVNGYYYNVHPIEYKLLLRVFFITLSFYYLFLLCMAQEFRVHAEKYRLETKIVFIISFLIAMIIVAIFLHSKEDFIGFYHFGKKFSGPWPGVMLWVAAFYFLVTVIARPTSEKLVPLLINFMRRTSFMQRLERRFAAGRRH